MKGNINILILLLIASNQINATIISYDKNKLKEREKFLTTQPIKNNLDDGIKGKFLINAGVGFNIWGTSMNVRHIASDFWSGKNYYDFTPKTTPMINISLDYGILKNLSVGVAYGYQKTTMTIANYQNNYLKFEDT